MKMFDEWWEENWTEQEFAGCKKCTETAFKAGMLAAADIAESDLSDDNDYNETCEWIAEAIRGAANDT